MRVLPFFVKSALATRLGSRMSAAVHITSVVSPVNTTEQLVQKLLRSYSEVFNYLLKKFPNNQAIAEMVSKILRYN